MRTQIDSNGWRHRALSGAAAVAAACLFLVGSATASAATTTITTATDFSAGTLTDVQLPAGIAATSADADLRLASGTPVWSANSAWNGPSQGSKTYSTPVLGDLDGDGDLDLIVGRKDGQAYAYRNTGTASAPTWTRMSAWDPPDLGSAVYSSPALGDIDGDGDLDLLLGRYDGETWAYRNDGSTAPVWTRLASWDPPARTGTVHATPALADLNSDGRPDVIVGADNDLNLAYSNTGDTSGTLWQRQSAWDTPHETSRGWAQIAVGDLDGDGLCDLLLGDSRGTVSVYRNTGTASAPTWTASSSWNPPQITAYATPTVGNLDDDRDVDLFLGSQRGTLDAVLDIGEGGATSGAWTSPVYDSADEDLPWTALAWTSRAVGTGATLIAEYRCGATADELAAAEWSTTSGGALTEDAAQRYIQLRFDFATTNADATAVLEDITLMKAEPLTGLCVTRSCYKRGSVTLAWSAPDDRTDLTYRIYRSGDLVASTSDLTCVDGPGHALWRGGVTYRIVALDPQEQIIARVTEHLTLP